MLGELGARAANAAQGGGEGAGSKYRVLEGAEGLHLQGHVD